MISGSWSTLTNSLQISPTPKDVTLTWPAPENSTKIPPTTGRISAHDPLWDNDSVHVCAGSKSQDLPRPHYEWLSISSYDFIKQPTPTRPTCRRPYTKRAYKRRVGEARPTLTKSDTGEGNISTMVEGTSSKPIMFDLPNVPASGTKHLLTQ